MDEKPCVFGRLLVGHGFLKHLDNSTRSASARKLAIIRCGQVDRVREYSLLTAACKKRTMHTLRAGLQSALSLSLSLLAITQGHDGKMVDCDGDPFPAFPEDAAVWLPQRAAPTRLSVALQIKEFGNEAFQDQAFVTAARKYRKVGLSLSLSSNCCRPCSPRPGPALSPSRPALDARRPRGGDRGSHPPAPRSHAAAPQLGSGASQAWKRPRRHSSSQRAPGQNTRAFIPRTSALVLIAPPRLRRTSRLAMHSPGPRHSASKPCTAGASPTARSTNSRPQSRTWSGHWPWPWPAIQPRHLPYTASSPRPGCAPRLAVAGLAPLCSRRLALTLLTAPAPALEAPSPPTTPLHSLEQTLSPTATLLAVSGTAANSTLSLYTVRQPPSWDSLFSGSPWPHLSLKRLEWGDKTLGKQNKETGKAAPQQTSAPMIRSSAPPSAG